MESGFYMVQSRKIDNAFNVSDTTGVGSGNSDEINQFVFNKLVALPDGIEDFTNSYRCLLYTSPSPRDRG